MIPSHSTVLNLSDAYTRFDLECAARNGDIALAIEIAMVLGAKIGRESVDIDDDENVKDLRREVEDLEIKLNKANDLKDDAEQDAFNKACEIRKLEDKIAASDRPDSEIVTEIKNELEFERGENARMGKIIVDICWDTKFRNKFMKSARYAEIQAAQK